MYSWVRPKSLATIVKLSLSHWRDGPGIGLAEPIAGHLKSQTLCGPFENRDENDA